MANIGGYYPNCKVRCFNLLIRRITYDRWCGDCNVIFLLRGGGYYLPVVRSYANVVPYCTSTVVRDNKYCGARLVFLIFWAINEGTVL